MNKISKVSVSVAIHYIDKNGIPQTISQQKNIAHAELIASNARLSPTEIVTITARLLFQNVSGALPEFDNTNTPTNDITPLDDLPFIPTP